MLRRITVASGVDYFPKGKRENFLGKGKGKGKVVVGVVVGGERE